MTKRYNFEYTGDEDCLRCCLIQEDPKGGYVSCGDYYKVVVALRTLLLGGEHEGPCDNKETGNPGPCYQHLDAAEYRETNAKNVLKELGEL